MWHAYKTEFETPVVELLKINYSSIFLSIRISDYGRIFRCLNPEFWSN